MIKKLIFIIIVLQINIFASSIINIDQQTKFIEILSKSQIYIDHSQKETFHQIKKQQFHNIKKDQLSFGYSPEINVWIKFQLKNVSDEPIHKIIQYDNSLTTNILFFGVEDPKNYIQDGLFHIRKNRNTITPIFKIKLMPHETKTYYLRVSSTITTLIVKLKLWDVSTFYNKEMEHQKILIFFFSAMLILAIYNLFIYFIIKDISYLYYVLYMIGIVVHQFFYTGIANIYLIPSIMPNIIKFATLIVAFPTLALALFTKYFLQTSQYRRIDKVLTVYIYIFPFLVSILLFFDELRHFRNVFSIFMIILLTYISGYAAFKRNRQAYFVLFGWFIFFTSAMIMYLSSAGIYNFYKEFPHYIEVALVLEALVFSIALADKIRQLEQDKNIANNLLIKRAKEQKNLLKEKVKAKTKHLQNAFSEIELLLRELNHRVKNNMQMIVSLIRLQSDEIEDEKMKDILITIQNRMNAMSHLHGLLYSQEGDINYVNTYEYFSILINELAVYFKSENIQIYYQIQSNIRSEQSVYGGLIINELVSNAFKHAFQNRDNGKINIKLSKKDTMYNLTVKDNGQGYNKSEKQDNLGLLIVQTLVEQQLKGKITVKADDGVEVNIQWVEVNIQWEEENYEA